MRPDAGARLPFSLLQSRPFQFGDFFQQALYLLIVLNGLANPWLPRLWHTDLTGLATMALNQIQRLMEFHPWRNGRWTCRTCSRAPTECHEETSGRKPIALYGNGRRVRRRRWRRGQRHRSLLE